MEKIHDTLGYTICRTARKIQKELTDELSEYDIPIAQWVALKTLAEHEGVSQKELAGLLQKDQNNVKAIVDRLSRKKLLARQRSEGDARAFELYLTGAGQKLVEKLASVDEQAIARIQSVLTEEEAKSFAALLARIEAGLDERQKISLADA